MLPVQVVLRRTVVAVDQQGVLHLRESQLPRFGDLIHDRLVEILDWSFVWEFNPERLTLWVAVEPLLLGLCGARNIRITCPAGTHITLINQGCNCEANARPWVRAARSKWENYMEALGSNPIRVIFTVPDEDRPPRGDPDRLQFDPALDREGSLGHMVETIRRSLHINQNHAWHMRCGRSSAGGEGSFVVMGAAGGDEEDFQFEDVRPNRALRARSR